MLDRGGRVGPVVVEGEEAFGGGQAIILRDGTLFGGSDARKDGCALGC